MVSVFPLIAIAGIVGAIVEYKEKQTSEVGAQASRPRQRRVSGWTKTTTVCSVLAVAIALLSFFRNDLQSASDGLGSTLPENSREQESVMLTEESWIRVSVNVAEAKDVLDQTTARMTDAAERDPGDVVSQLYRYLENLSRLINGAKIDLDLLGKMLGYDGNVVAINEE
jgi:hypothetical protein